MKNKTIRIAVILTAVAILGLGWYKALGYAKSTNSVPIIEESEVIKNLAKCESGNNPKAINKEDGGSPSYGYLQWKKTSFLFYNKKYKILPALEEGEVMNIIMDKDAQIALATEVLKEKNGWMNWYNCLLPKQ